jgi:hypothetical protein
MRCAIPAGLMPASGQNPKLPHRNSNGRFTSISGHNVAAVFLSDAWVMRQVPTSLGNRFPLALAVPQLSVCLLRLLTLRPNWVIISCLPRLDRLHSHSRGSRCGAHLLRIGGGSETPWLGRQDSNIRIPESRRNCPDRIAIVKRADPGGGLAFSSPSAKSLGFDTIIWNAKFRILPPQPGSTVSELRFLVAIRRLLVRADEVIE